MDDTMNLANSVQDKIDAAIPPLSEVEQSVLDTFAEHVVNQSPIGVGDVSCMCEVADLIGTGVFGTLDNDTVVATFHELQRLGLVRIDTQLSPLDAMLTAKGWMSWSLWEIAVDLPVIADGPAGNGWDWDSLLPSLKDPLRTQIILRITGFREKHPDGMLE